LDAHPVGALAHPGPIQSNSLRLGAFLPCRDGVELVERDLLALNFPPTAGEVLSARNPVRLLSRKRDNSAYPWSDGFAWSHFDLAGRQTKWQGKLFAAVIEIFVQPIELFGQRLFAGVDSVDSKDDLDRISAARLSS